MRNVLASAPEPEERNVAQATRLRQLLVRADLSQRAAARELDVSDRAMRYWCAGQCDVPVMVFLALEQIIARQMKEDFPA